MPSVGWIRPGPCTSRSRSSVHGAAKLPVPEDNPNADETYEPPANHRDGTQLPTSKLNGHTGVRDKQGRVWTHGPRGRRARPGSGTCSWPEANTSTSTGRARSPTDPAALAILPCCGMTLPIGRLTRRAEVSRGEGIGIRFGFGCLPRRRGGKAPSGHRARATALLRESQGGARQSFDGDRGGADRPRSEAAEAARSAAAATSPPPSSS